MVKVVLAFESFGLLIWGQDFVEAVLADDGYLPLMVVHLVLAKKLHDLGANSRLRENVKKKKKRAIVNI